MEKFLNALFSMRSMALAMLVFFVSIGVATFIESGYGVQASRLSVYNALWFEILLAYLSINLLANVFRYKMWMREKIAMFAFHIAFLVILLGAAITRFVGFEGIMMIREGAASNIVYSADPYLVLFNHDQKLKYAEKMLLSDFNNNDFEINVEFPGHKTPVKIEYVNFLSKHIDSLVINDSIKGAALEIVTNGMQSNYVPENDVFPVGQLQLAYGNQKVNGVNVYKKNGKLMMRPTVPIQFIPMAMMQQARQTGAAIPDSAYVQVLPNEEVPFATTTLYMMGGQQFVFKQEIQHAKKYKLPSGKKDVGSDYLVVRVTEGGESKVLMLEGGMGMLPTPEVFLLDGHVYRLEYGSKEIKTPFHIGCEDFIMERYPGSDVASSYASDLQILDSTNKVFKKKRVFMNHVMDYGGYRFFQSSYDPDEKGTRLSVNYDYWGTTITYIGYLLMGIGMILSLFAPSGRFRELIRKLKKSREKQSKALSVLLVFFTLAFGSAFAQDTVVHQHDHEHEHTHEHAAPAPAEKRDLIFRIISEEHSDELASLLVQDFDGRIVPMHTVCDQLLRKLYRSNKYEGKNAVQTVISMHMYPNYWATQKIIQVPSAVREKYDLEAYASFEDLSDDHFQFKWLNDYNVAWGKTEAKRSETEKKLIKLVEKYQVFGSITQWSYMKLIPVKKDSRNTWYVPMSREVMQRDSVSSSQILRYFVAVDTACMTKNYAKALSKLDSLKAFQRETAPASILPSETHVKVEISYNKMGIFKNAEYSYLLIGFTLLVFSAIGIAIPSKKKGKAFRIVRNILVGLLVVIFLYHATGMIMRWYISGHAPWSNGYEAVIFIAWIAMIAGFIFRRFHDIILGAAALMAFFMIFVTEMNLLDPEITPLQPVLKSYWLMIHVAIITGSYGFLGLSFKLGIINLILYITRSNEDKANITKVIKKLTYVSEMLMIIGLFMLTIGTFLGGVWANESWGRYWGWDPKETWALVSVLVYAIILHFRFIPGMKSKFLFNVASVWGYSAILFTFFGVNFILVGLHSYAQGDGSVGLPPGVIITIGAFVAFTIIAIFRNRSYKKHKRAKL